MLAKVSAGCRISSEVTMASQDVIECKRCEKDGGQVPTAESAVFWRNG